VTSGELKFVCENRQVLHFYKLTIYYVQQNSSAESYNFSRLAAHHNIKNWQYQIVLNLHVTRIFSKVLKTNKIFFMAINDDYMSSVSAR
jgi:hypothetical protein